ncbi:unnamed protein product [Hymenolepis diminuta]|uniref:Protein kinase domain-containing protein n=1 Tax=Hymenolepis diminuta TaxID=6216 RepID=A0A564YX97_HYMDI|nr:unnamed protein product [Hymenolepis diminuta]
MQCSYEVKPENIMIEDMETKRIKIIDFGLARKLNPNEVIQDMAGTPEFCENANEVKCYTMPFCTMSGLRKEILSELDLISKAKRI